MAEEGKVKIDKFDGTVFWFLEYADRRLSISKKTTRTAGRGEASFNG